MLGVDTKNGCPRLRITKNKKTREFYGFYSEQQAAYVWDAMKRILHPEATRYNFPNDVPEWADAYARRLLR